VTVEPAPIRAYSPTSMRGNSVALAPTLAPSRPTVLSYSCRKSLALGILSFVNTAFGPTNTLDSILAMESTAPRKTSPAQPAGAPPPLL
jgi:hypothetical protein